MADKGKEDPREGGHTIQNQGGHLKKALRTPNGTLFGEQAGRQWETRGGRTLGKADTPSNKRKQEGRQGGGKTSGR